MQNKREQGNTSTPVDQAMTVQLEPIINTCIDGNEMTERIENLVAKIIILGRSGRRESGVAEKEAA